jgi:adenylate cyclase class IV
VRGLGSFIEFEVLVKHGKWQAQKLLELLSVEFDIKRNATIAVSYFDLVFNSKRIKKV